jgi:hypothetical protein
MLGLGASLSTSGAISGFSNIKSINFDGVDDYIDCGDSNDFSFGDGSTDSSFSISMWVKLNDPSQQPFCAKAGSSTKEYHILSGHTDKLRFRLYDQSTNAYIQCQLDDVVSTGSWVYYTFTYDGSGSQTGITIYKDGSSPTQTQTSSGTYTAMENTTSALRIASSEMNSFYLDGDIDEVALFNIELSSAQVTDIYNSGTPTDLSSHTGLVGYWRMGDGATSPTIPDDSSNSNDGTMTNMVSGDITTAVP